MKPLKISIIIPILNEEAVIGHLLQHIITNSSQQNIAEIIVADGGSTDNSKSKVIGHNVVFLNSKKGRAQQMNFGAKYASGDILYFLHADSHPPKYFDASIIQEVRKGHLAGCFRMKFKSQHWWLYLAGWFTQFNWRICRGGDQSLFIAKELFDAIGGFDERFVVYEDNQLIDKLYDLKQFKVIQKWITTSPRRYQTNGIWKLQYHFWAIHLKKRFGASAKELQAYYEKHIV